jgi:hypothetical protein
VVEQAAETLRTPFAKAFLDVRLTKTPSLKRKANGSYFARPKIVDRGGTRCAVGEVDEQSIRQLAKPRPKHGIVTLLDGFRLLTL